MHSLNHDIKFNQKKYSKNTTKIDTNPQSHPSGSHGLDHVNISTELNDPEIEGKNILEILFILIDKKKINIYILKYL